MRDSNSIDRKTPAINRFAGRVQFHILSFEGPDEYSAAGGLASRVNGLTQAVSIAGHDTHLWFIGDPELPGEQRRSPHLTLHRWCQWISRYHPSGVYEGEEGKKRDYAASLPPFLIRQILLPHLLKPGARSVILAEDWHTVDAVLHLDWLLRRLGVRDRVDLLWNANNTFGFERINWGRLAAAATVTTVSRYMRYLMWTSGVDPVVVPNGIPRDLLRAPPASAVREFQARLQGRFALAKLGRYDPDKRWVVAVDTLAELKRRGWRPLLIARGGAEPHGVEVLRRAGALGLRIERRSIEPMSVHDFLSALSDLEAVDLLSLESTLGPAPRQVLYRAAQAVLANSGHEPFGLVGLETMAAGGVACIGGTGEDYAVPGWNSILLQTPDPREFLRLFRNLLARPADAEALRRHGVLTAHEYTWSKVIRRNLLPRLRQGEPAGTPDAATASNADERLLSVVRGARFRLAGP